MKRIFAIAIAIGFGTLVSCGQKETSKYPDYTKLEENLYLKKVVENSEGREVKPGDVVSLTMKYTTEGDSTLFQSEPGQPLIQIQADSGSYTGDFMGAFLGAHEGDSLSIIVNADSFFLKTARMPEVPNFIDSGSVLYFSVGLKKVQTMEEMQAATKAEQARLQSEEIALLDEYIKANNITVEPTSSGMYFIQKQAGTGVKPQAGDKVKVNYEGRLLDGTYFDTSIEEVAKAQGLYDERRPYEPFEFTLGQGQVIPGWDEGISKMKKGGKATFIIPSQLAYGANPRPGGVIKPFNTLIFEVELIDVTKASE